MLKKWPLFVETENLLRVRNILPRISIPSQKNPAHAIPSHFFKIQLNVQLSTVFRASKWFPLFRVYNHSFHAFLFSPITATCPTHLTISDFITSIIFGERYKYTAHIEAIHTVIEQRKTYALFSGISDSSLITVIPNIEDFALY